jgi:CheY-like chemotaxis protein
MGCVSSRRVSLSVNGPGSDPPKHSPNAHQIKSTSIQDDARSFRSKVGALKMLIRNTSSFNSLLHFLQEIGREEFLICYRDMEEIKLLADEQLISRTAALIWRYKTIVEAARLRGNVLSSVEYSVWECFGKLRQLDMANASIEIVKKYLIIAQNEALARLVLPFDEYLLSPHYKEWQSSQIVEEKQRRVNSRSNSIRDVAASSKHYYNNNNNNSSGLATPTSHNNNSNSLAGTPMTQSVSMSVVHSNTNMISDAVNSEDYPDILVVDDSLVTLKITGLTLECDGHNVDRASNGQIALELMKSRKYDVVLIDCNMPVMDGFETVRFFREYEQQHTAQHPALFYKFKQQKHHNHHKRIDEENEEDEDRDNNNNNNQSASDNRDQVGNEADNEDDDLSSISDSDDGFTNNHNNNNNYHPANYLNNNNHHFQSQSLSPTLARNYAALGPEIAFDITCPSNRYDDNNHNHQVDALSPSTQYSDSQILGLKPNVSFHNTNNKRLLSAEKKMRRNLTDAHYHQLIIGISSAIDDETRDRALAAGMDFFLKKPFTIEKFIETLRISKQLKREQNPGSEIAPILLPVPTIEQLRERHSSNNSFHSNNSNHNNNNNNNNSTITTTTTTNNISPLRQSQKRPEECATLFGDSNSGSALDSSSNNATVIQ